MDLMMKRTNTGTGRVECGLVNEYLDYWSWVFDRDEAACPFTPFGHRKMGGERGIFKRYIVMRLGRDESHDRESDLGKCFELRPGKYMVSVSVKLNRTTHPFEMAAKDVECGILGSNVAIGSP